MGGGRPGGLQWVEEVVRKAVVVLCFRDSMLSSRLGVLSRSGCGRNWSLRHLDAEVATSAGDCKSSVDNDMQSHRTSEGRATDRGRLRERIEHRAP